jgi:hypothetical protein
MEALFGVAASVGTMSQSEKATTAVIVQPVEEACAGDGSLQCLQRVLGAVASAVLVPLVTGLRSDMWPCGAAEESGDALLAGWYPGSPTVAVGYPITSP